MNSINFDHIYLLLKRRKETVWCKSKDLHYWVNAVLSEAQELSNSTSIKNTEEECGDVLSEILTTILHLEELTLGQVSLESVLQSIEEKLKRRKPWMFDASIKPPASPEEEHAIWLAAKAQEKYGR